DGAAGVPWPAPGRHRRARRAAGPGTQSRPGSAGADRAGRRDGRNHRVSAGTLRSLPVPDGLDGERVDAALSRMFGLSRTKAADLAADGRVMIDGSVVGKADKVRGGAWLEVELPPPPVPVEQTIPEPVPGMRIVHDDDHIVVVDKPVGVAAHPSPGWLGPTVVGGLAAAGYR